MFIFKKTLFTLVGSVLIFSSFGSTGFAEPQLNLNSQIKLAANQKLIVNIPPNGWNPLTATDAELDYYAYPARPADPTELEKWKGIVSGQWEVPVMADKKRDKAVKQASDLSFSQSASDEDSSHVVNTSVNWAGWERGGSVSRVTGFWRQPVVSADASHRPAYASEWIGISNSSVIIQAGTDSNVNADNSGFYGIWWELIGTNQSEASHYLTNFAHNGGDTYYSDISYSSGTANFYIADSTSGATTSFKVTGITFTGSLDRAEWIVEKTAINGSVPANLANFNYVHFAQSQYGSASSLSYLSGSSSLTNVYKDNMVNTAGSNIIAQPGAINSTGDFDVTWYNYN